MFTSSASFIIELIRECVRLLPAAVRSGRSVRSKYPGGLNFCRLAGLELEPQPAGMLNNKTLHSNCARERFADIEECARNQHLFYSILPWALHSQPHHEATPERVRTNSGRHRSFFVGLQLFGFLDGRFTRGSFFCLFLRLLLQFFRLLGFVLTPCPFTNLLDDKKSSSSSS